MITLIIYGLDQFVVGDLSRDLTPGLAKLYEVKEDEINFIAPSDMVFHKGAEQTSWNVIIHVHAPMKVSVLQDFVKDFIFKSIGDLAIHKVVEFYYYSQDNRYEDINPKYNRYLEDDVNVNIDEEDYQDKEEGEGEDDIYTGDIFEGVADQLEKQHHHDDCDCDEDCDDDCCSDEHCHCGHHHHN